MAAPPAETGDQVAELQAQLREARATIDAIRSGAVDSLVTGSPGQEQVYSLATADRIYRRIVEAMSEGTATISPHGTILDANPQLSYMTGRPLPKLIGTAVTDLIRPAQEPAFGRLLDIGPGASARGEIELTGPGGTAVPVLLAASAFDLDGMLVRSLVLTDLSARRAAEEQAQAAAAYNRSLIEASLDPLLAIDVDGTITDINRAAETVTGRSRDELLGTGFADCFSRPELARAGYEQVLKDGSVRDLPLEFRDSSGRVTPVQFNASVYRGPSGQVLGIFAAARDVTQIRQAQAALLESEERYRVTFEHAPVGICDRLPGGQIVRVNPRYCGITGYTAQELLTMSGWELVPPDDLAEAQAGNERLLSGRPDSSVMDSRLLAKGGDVIWVQSSRTVVRDPEGNPQFVVAAVRDITAERTAEAKIKALNADLEARVEQRTADLERANRDLETFSYSVSHDLRAPLRALSGFSQALLEDCGDRVGETGRGYAQRIVAASERMSELIDDVLKLSRVSRATLSLAPVQLSAEVSEIAAGLQAQDPGRRVTFRIQDGIWAAADRVLIHAALQNLLDNAWKFTSHRAEAEIEFGSTAGEEGEAAGTAGDAGLCCYVRDNGAGFDPEYAGQLFQPFQRLHAVSEFPGNGIGLASVRRIIERHGGRIWARGGVDQGATFYFTLNAATSP